MRRLLSLLVLSFPALPGGTSAQTGGRDVYVAKCSACHAPDGSGNSSVGRSLKLDDIRPAIQNSADEQLRQLIVEGRGKMPANKKLNEEQLRSLTVFLRDLAAGNPDTGQAVQEAQSQPLPNVKDTFRDKCSACHGSDGAGHTTIGQSLKIPDLTSAAVQRMSGEELARTITEGRGRMPAYAKKFNPVQVDQLAAYIRTLSNTSRPKEATQSKEELQAPSSQPTLSRPSETAPKQAAAPAAPNDAIKAAPAESPKEVGNEVAVQPKPARTANVKKAPLTARQLYAAKCSACHSRDGSGTGTIGKSMNIPSLLSPQVQDKRDDALAEVVRDGLGKMPAYKKKFSPEQIQLLVAYVRELANKR